jgi:outer membrane protein assembly factor BamB
MNRRRFLRATSILPFSGCLSLQSSTSTPDADTVTCPGKSTTNEPADSSTVSSISGQWTTSQFDVRNTSYNSSATGPQSCPRVQWQFTIDLPDPRNTNPEWIPGSPVVADGTVYVADHVGHIYALNTRTGEKRWRYTTYKHDKYGDPLSMPTYADGVLYFAGGIYLQAVDVNSQKELWHHESTEFDSGPDLAALFFPQGAPTVADGVVYTGDKRGVITAYDAKTGEKDWEIALRTVDIDETPHRSRTVDANDRNGHKFRLIGSPAVDDGTVYVGTAENAIVYALDAKTGNIEWMFTVDDYISIPPTVADGTVYVAGTSDVFALDSDDGSVQWSVWPNKGERYIQNGAVGLCGVLAAKRLGAERIIAMGHHEDRLEVARELGATEVVSARGEEAVEEAHELTYGGANRVLECVGAASSLETAAGVVRPGGNIGYVGVPHVEDPTFLQPLFFSNASFTGGPAPVRAYAEELMDDVLQGTLDPSPIFTKTVGLDDIAEGYRAMDERDAIKVLVKNDA